MAPAFLRSRSERVSGPSAIDAAGSRTPSSGAEKNRPMGSSVPERSFRRDDAQEVPGDPLHAEGRRLGGPAPAQLSEVWGKAGATTRIVVAGKNSDTVPSGTLSSIRRASGLEHLR